MPHSKHTTSTQKPCFGFPSLYQAELVSGCSLIRKVLEGKGA